MRAFTCQIQPDCGIVDITPRFDKVLILGAATGWQEAPIDDPDTEVWGLNRFWDWWGEVATRWFEIHPLAVLREQREPVECLEESEIPIYMDRVYPTIPMSVRFPIETVSAGHLRLFTSTFSYELALAIHEGFKEIGLYGVNFSRGTARERLVEWRALLYWFGVAEGRGITVTLPEGFEAFEHRYLYGLDYWDEVRDTRRQIQEFRKAATDGVKWWMRWRAALGGSSR